MEYNFRSIEQKWHHKWQEWNSYKVSNDSARPKYYVLDMFPYPSGTGLHVGHPLGYIASDIYSRYKRLKGFNVLHPMGFDSFGLPAEQYAIETGQHPAVTTEKNINTYRSQLDNIGFGYDWSREVRTSDPSYYRWTQWIFLQIFNSWYDRKAGKAKKLEELVAIFKKEGNSTVGKRNSDIEFSAADWLSFDEKKQEEILMNYRLAFSSFGEVNWCEALGTVLANDEVINGVSERGGHLVIKKRMRQWYLRITEYADRLLAGLDQVAFSDSLKEQQRNWIGKSQGSEISFDIKDAGDKKLKVYTTRPDTIFGVDFMVIAPEHELVSQITTPGQQQAIDEYLTYVKSRSERERMAEVKQITGCFTGAFAINPFNGREIPVWIAEYVLAGYGTGAIMAVPCGDQRDYNFATHFSLPITNIIGNYFNGAEANPTKEAILENSGFLDGLVMKDAMDVAISKLEELNIGKRHVNYRMRDAGFSRQRYWGEPFPIVWKDGIAYPLDENELPLELPYVDKYGPGPEGEGPLANITEWVNLPGGGKRETSTMPGYAGSSWYFLRYMDPYNNKEFCNRKASDYWGQVDLYIGGTEHAVGHLLYSRLWTKILFDLDLIGHDEPYKKLLNQGMIQGKSYFATGAYQVEVTSGKRVLFLHSYFKEGTQSAETDALRLGFNINERKFENATQSFQQVRIKNGHRFIDSKDRLTESEYKKNYSLDEENEEIVIWEKQLTENGERYIQCAGEIEKMSKSKYNVDNPDEIVDKYGADTFRMYEMFLGPVEMSKPWDTKGIEGVHRFLRKLWRLFFDEVKGKVWNNDTATDAELKILHRTIKKIEEDTEKFSFNTAVSAFMVCVNELGDLKCYKKAVLEKLLILLTPYAPHIAEELWSLSGNEGSILDAEYPAFEERYLVETNKEYPVSINGKVRTIIGISLIASQEEVEQIVLANETVQKWLEGKQPKKIIYVKNKMINMVV